MKNRTIVTLSLAGVLILVVMCASLVISLVGVVNAQKFEAAQSWSKNFFNAESMKIIDLTGDGQDDLFIQNQPTVSVWDASGNGIFEADFGTPLATTMGDINGDNVEDIVVFSLGNVQVIANSQLLWSVDVGAISAPSRVAVVRYASGVQIVLGDQSGQLRALAADGSELWQTNLSSADYIRGLDDARLGGQIFLAAANHDGSVALFDDRGQALWTFQLPSTLRRLRAYDLNNDGNGELLVGGDSGELVVLNAADGSALFRSSLGQAITEIREVELDGEPSSREFVVGGKDGGVWGFKLDGTKLWSKSVSGKVTEIVGLDVNDDGTEETIIGDESGGVYLFNGVDGERHNLLNRQSAIMRIDAGKLSGSDQIVVADASQVGLFDLEYASFTPLQYTPLLVGLIVSLLIAAVAWFLATIPPKPTTKLAIEDQTPESLQAQRRMLKENIADVERLRSAGEMTADAYLARLKQLRSQLAENETSLRKAGVGIRPETITCPNCGGVLPLGMDRCEYCGQVVIT
jgi:outer membrane protein assembly factor BamB